MKINMTTAFVASFVAIAGIAALANPSLVSGLVSPSAAQTAQTDTNGAAANGQADTIRRHIDEAVDAGATVFAQAKIPENSQGIFVAPTVLTDVNHDMTVMREETFGPVLGVMAVQDMDQAADALIGAGYGAAGERCMAISVAVPVGDETADRLIEKLVPRIEKLKVGPYTAGEDVDYGPVITAAAKARIEAFGDAGGHADADRRRAGGGPGPAAPAAGHGTAARPVQCRRRRQRRAA